jgi:hypothetical protein
MASVSQNGRRKQRPWTAQDQIIAEVAAACGVNYAEIGRVLGRTGGMVKIRVNLSAAEKQRESDRRYHKANIDERRKKSRRYYELNRDKALDAGRRYYKSNREKVRASQRGYREANAFRLREYYSLYHEANREKRRESDRRYREVNRDRIRERHRRYHQANIDRRRESCRRYYELNHDRLRDYRRRYYELNHDRLRDYQRRWQKANAGKVRENIRRRNAWKRAARRRALHPVTRAQIDARFALWSNHCAFCGVDASDPRNHGRERLTVEHVLALTKGGLDEASNIIPACTACNSSKHNAPVDDWYRQQPWFTEARWAKIRKYCPAAVVGQLPLGLAA